ncbi:MAG: bifunctional hydroxymethylpyrimidine kinase/phosphomethylpyrimidine kinase [Planctomycetota bacterium]
MIRPLRLLLIGGIDSSHGAGLDADRDAARHFAADVEEYVSADTEQDERGVQRVEPRPFWWFDAGYAIEDGIDALKIGLLPDLDAIEGAAQLAGHARSAGFELPVVIDTVIAASSGTRFWGSAEVALFRRLVLRTGPILTPNLPELAELTGGDLAELCARPELRVEAARMLLRLGARAVVVKGGHGDESPLLDLVVPMGEDPTALARPRLPGGGIRGSGCRFATALACGLGRRVALADAARAAGEFVAGRIHAAAP